ncbi:hypothetical protein Tco_0715996 [Tanacetum coccineum]
MDNPNLTMKEYVRLEEEKARKCRKVFDWKTATYGKIRVDDDFYDLRSMEAEFPSIVINDDFAPKDTLQCKSQVSIHVNEEIDFRISFDEFDDEDYTIIVTKTHIALPPHKQRHRFLRYEGLEYTDLDIADFESRMAMEHRDEAGVVVFTSQAWRRLFDTRGPLVWELIMEFLSTLRFGEVLLDLDALGLHTGEEMESPSFARYWSESERMIPGKGDLHDYWRDILTDGDFLGPPLSYTLIRDLVLRLCHRMMAHSIAGRSQAHEKVTMTGLFYLIGMARLEEDVHEIRGALIEQREVIDAMARDFSRFSTWVTTGLGRMMDRAGVTYTPYSQTHMSYQRRVRQRTGEANTSAA